MGAGIRVTQTGVSVDFASDYQEVLDDRWPELEFEFCGELTISGTVDHKNAFIPIFQHTLPYLAPFFIFIKSTNQSIDGSSFKSVNGQIGFTIFSSGSTTNYTLTAYLMVLRRDITQEFEASRWSPTAGSNPGGTKYGLKITKNGANIDSNDKRDFSLNTGARAFIIHKHGIVNANSGNSFVLTINHNVGYPPTYFLCARGVETGVANPIVGQTSLTQLGNGSGFSNSNATTMTMRGAQSALNGDYAYLILKDPVDTAK